MTLPDPHTIYLLAAAGIIGSGVYGLLAVDHLLRKLLALNVLGSGVFLLMVTLPSRAGAPDPVSHALVLTGLVIAVSVTAFALALLDRLYRETGELRLEPEPESVRESPTESLTDRVDRNPARSRTGADGRR
jgi:multicomponent Na+:H+ antiporter subunit C